MTNVKQPGGSLAAAVGDGITDDKSAIQAIVNQAAISTIKKVFFPPGVYQVNGDIAIADSVELYGTQSGIAVIKARDAYAIKIHNASPVTHVSLKYLYFDGIRVEFEGRSTNNITIEGCVFFSSQNPGTASNAWKKQLKMVNLRQGRVTKNVFMRDSHAYGVAISFAHTVNVTLDNNLCGLKLSQDMLWLSDEVEPKRYWSGQKNKLEFLKTHYHLQDDQGYFKSCLYEHCDEGMQIEKNVFNGSPNTGRHRDHAIYLKGFDNMTVISNYVRGWPANASGGIKARNGQNLWLVRNYVDDTGILLYSHDNKRKKACIYVGLKNVVVYGNHLRMQSNLNNSTSGLRYHEPHHNVGRDENIKYSGNEFEIIGVSNPTDYPCIWLTNGNPSEHHVYADNTYFGRGNTVRIAGRHGQVLGPAAYERGDFNQSIKNTLNRYPLYKPNIPLY